MERPWTVCHMLASVDGKIDGAFLRAPEAAGALAAYGRIRSEYDCDAVLYGTVTMAGGFSAGMAPDNLPTGRGYPRTDYAAPRRTATYIVSLDPTGTLGWDAPVIAPKGRPEAQVIEVLTDAAGDDYVSYLRQFDISYVFAGQNQIDCPLLLSKLQRLFGIRRLMIAGGGCTDWSFLQAGCLDELSLVVAPLADGSTTAVSIFEQMSGAEGPPAVLTLDHADRLESSVLWLRYGVRRP